MLALLAAQTAAPAGALPPTGKWLVEYNEGDCTMSRSFGSKTSPLIVAFQPSPTGSLGEVILLLPAKGRGGLRFGQGSVVLYPSGERFKSLLAITPLPGDRRGVRFAAPPEFWDALPGATALTIDLGNEPDLAITLGVMKNPLAAIKTCSDDLLRGWGVEPGAVARFRRGNNPALYFKDGAYPGAAILARAQGRTIALLSVDRDGMPSACRAVQSSKSVVLDETTCSVLMRNARFERAAPTEAARRSAVLSVRWALPD